MKLIDHDHSISPVEIYSPPPPLGGRVPSAAKTSWITRHWRGEHSLARSYWINGVLIITTLQLGNLGILIMTEQGRIDPSHALVFLTLMLVAVTSHFIWWVVGTWRSADKRKGFWATIVQALLVLHVAATLIRLGNLFV